MLLFDGVPHSQEARDRQIADITPQLDPELYVFSSVIPEMAYGSEWRNIILRFLGAIALARLESGDYAVVLPQDKALEWDWDGEFPCRLITLDVDPHTPNRAFVAALMALFEDLGITVRFFRAYPNLWLFVEDGRGADAMQLLRSMAADATRHLELLLPT